MRRLAGLAGLVLLLALPAARAATWRLATVELPPSISASAPEQGYYAVLLRRILGELGDQAAFTFLPPQRAMQEAAQGQWDGVFPYRRTPEREALFWFTEPFFIAKVRLFLRADDGWEPADVAALQGRLGCTLHSAQAPARLQREVNAGRLKLQTVNQLDACFRMLQLRRVDFVIAGQNTGWDAQQRLAAEGLRLRAAGLVVAEEPVHLALSRRLPGSAARVERFNRALRRLRAQGTLQRLEAASVPQPGELGGAAPTLKPPAGR